MSKQSILFYFLLVAALLGFSTVQAQTAYEWDDYGLSFSVPAGFKASASTGDKFEGSAERAGLTLFGLYPIADANLTMENLEDFLVAMASESGMQVDEASEIEFNGFYGYYAEGDIEGIPTFFACMLDPDGELNFIITILHNNADVAIKVVRSIQKM
ncbi:MAG: hypothetical protein JJT94_15680 [Bernardetiaceae bacterium]|nr:hypothetical protein [Bernardetiaceae bacterium]